MSLSTACQSEAVAGTPFMAGFQLLLVGAEYWPDPLRGIVVYLYTVGMTEDILRSLATPAGVFLYMVLLEWLRRRCASSQRAAGQDLRSKSYLFGRKLANWIRG
ncbi:MAG: hypothetical protein DDT26_00157 [Dehalococcoidia bacterium]|nr:hypothetical protein [Chloroflexota bacterium]